MLKVTNDHVMNFENAIRGIRNPLNSWDRSDSSWDVHDTQGVAYYLGDNDLGLAKRLAKAGTDHRKFMRQIFVSLDILAPLYWWKQFDKYQVGVTTNSCSTMHRIHKEPFTMDMFSFEGFEDDDLEMGLLAVDVVGRLNYLRDKFIETKDKRYWLRMVQFLPSSYNQLRTVTLNYEVLSNIYHARKGHKVKEWDTLCDFIKTLPYAQELIIRE